MDTADLPQGYELLACHPHAVPRALAMQRLAADPMAMDRWRGTPARNDDSIFGSYRVENGVALLPVAGTLVASGGEFLQIFGMLSQEVIRKSLTRAMADEDVSSIVLMFDTPGGFATGTDLTAELIRQISKRKRITAAVSGMAASAGYWLAAQCNEIICSPISELGSIGVLSVHADLSEAFASAGIKHTVIARGDKKGDGNPFEPLSDDAKADLETRVNDLWREFAGEVHLGRGKRLSVDAIMKMESATYLGADAVSAGLADRVGYLTELLEVSTESETISVRTHTRTRPAPIQKADAVIQPIVQRQVIAKPMADIDSARKSARYDEKARIEAILNHPAAEKQPKLAQHLAFETDLPAIIAEQALDSAAMDNAEEDKPATLAEEMRNYKSPTIGLDGGPKVESLSAEDRGAIMARRLLQK